MTTRQHHEAVRIEHRYGRTRIRRAGGDTLELDVIGDTGGVPRFRLVLGSNGHVLERVTGVELELDALTIIDPMTAAADLRRRLARDADLDVAIVSLLLTHREWVTAQSLAGTLDVKPDRVARSLKRLDAGGLVESRGRTRDRQWRSQG